MPIRNLPGRLPGLASLLLSQCPPGHSVPPRSLSAAFPLSLFVGCATADSAPEHPRQVSGPAPGGPASRWAPARSPAAGLFQLLPSAFPAPGPAEQCSVSLPPSLGTSASPLPSSQPLSLSWHILQAPPLSRACSLPPWLAPAWLTPVPPSATLCSLFPAQCLLPLPALGHLFIQTRSIMQG